MNLQVLIVKEHTNDYRPRIYIYLSRPLHHDNVNIGSRLMRHVGRCKVYILSISKEFFSDTMAP